MWAIDVARYHLLLLVFFFSIERLIFIVEDNNIWFVHISKRRKKKTIHETLSHIIVLPMNFSRILTVDWLPTSYVINQVAIILFGCLAIIHTENLTHIELVRWIYSMNMFHRCSNILVIGYDKCIDSIGFHCHRHAFWHGKERFRFVFITNFILDNVCSMILISLPCYWS
jgi:hypothetical protein